MEYTAVFQGGGMKGIAYIGAIIALEEHGFVAKRACGTSIGAFFASLVAMGYTGQEMYDIFTKINISTLFNEKVNIKNVLSEKGLHSILPFEYLIRQLAIQKNKLFYTDLIKNGRPTLKVVATDLTSKRLIVFPDDFSKYNVAYDTLYISTSVAMSAAFPGYFKPLKLNNHIIVDGGIYNNFPYNVYSYEKDEIVIGFILNKNPIKNLPPHILQLNIDTKGTKMLDFKMNKEKQYDLIKQGYEDARRFINRFIAKREKC